MTQPGHRASAPVPLDVVQAFVNSVDLLDGTQESFTDSTATARWLHDHGLTGRRPDLDASDVIELIAVREAIRQLCHAQRDSAELEPASAETLTSAAARAGLAADFASGGRLRSPAEGVQGVIATLLAIVQQTMLDGRLRRLKACKHCGWVFHDSSRSRSGQWCTMSICGNRAKNRAHRQRHQPPTPSTR